MTPVDRRTFLTQVAGFATMTLTQAPRRRWTDRLGLQVYTVRDRLAKDFAGTLAAVSAEGYKDVELFGSLGERTPQQVRAILDEAGLSAVSTHIAVTPGPDLDRQLEGYQVIGHRFTAVRTEATPAGEDGWKRVAEILNAVGGAGQRHGIRALFHNHVAEFVPFANGRTPYDVLLAHTDPALVVMELDVGWASIAGQDPVALFKQHPGRFALWHVKDTTALAAITARPMSERLRAAQFVPVGEGDVDYKRVFAAAETAGLQHYFVEQDNAVNGDSLAAIRASAGNLRKLLG